MARKIDGDRLILATHNQKKITEFSALFSPYHIDVTSALEIDLPEPEETEDSFEGNAILKARAAAEVSGLPALADDSGLCVDALGGQPGIYSARWAVQEDGSRDFRKAMERVHALLVKENKQRSARFVAVLALVWPDGHSEVFRGECEGHLIWPPRGHAGFGYDPMFVPGDERETFAENPDLKEKYAHRHIAFYELAKTCLTAKAA